MPPEQVPDVQALVGDPTDNVPGVPGVGPKAAAALISELGSLEAILAYKDRPDALDATLQERLATLQGEIDALAGQPVKINSGGQIAEVLAQKFGIEDLPLDKKGRPTADAETLERLGCDHPFCRTLVRARNLSRAIGATTRKVLENADQALVSKRLVTLDCNSPLAVPAEDLALDRLDPKRLVAFLKALELNQLVRRIAEAYAVDVAEVEPDPRLRSGAGGITWDQAQFQAAERGEPAQGAGAPARAGTNGAAPAVAEGEAAAMMVPAALAAKRATEVAKIPFDTAAYRCIASVEELDAVLARARETGILALDTETNSLDATRAELVGVSLALEPGRACYVPLQHRDEADLFGGGLVPGQIPVRDALDALRPLCEDRAVLKIGQNLKFDWIVLKRHGIEVAPYDDTMLISYVLDAGRHGLAGYGMDELSKRHLDHAPITFGEVAGAGKAKVTFDRVAIAGPPPTRPKTPT